MEHAHRFLFEQTTDKNGMCRGICACGAEVKQFGGDWQEGIKKKTFTVRPEMVARTRDFSREYFIESRYQGFA
jgi:hypothetical protein